MKTQELRNALEQQKGQRSFTASSLDKANKMLAELETQTFHIEEAKTIARLVAKQTQEQLEYRISELVSLALAAVFGDSYGFKAEFVERREKTECDLWLVKDGEKEDPLNSEGGGIADVLAFGLRVSMWTLGKPRTRNTMFLDEPGKHIKGEAANIRFIQMVKTVSEKLGLQFIVVSDERAPMEAIEKGADKVFEFKLKRVRGLNRPITEVTER